ncbi:hypothetical protein CPB85DRAFT_1436915 [Mucidula mucida]|nr:hypothetical protein CPB85DRAFT_1436915 [Mucidula mucida]
MVPSPSACASPFTDIQVVSPPSAVTRNHSLPPEVLSQIFLAYLALCQPPFSVDVFPIIFSHSTVLQVCRRWYTITLADPWLWTTIPVIAAQSDVSEPQSEYQCALQRRIQHTSALSLRLYFFLVVDTTLFESKEFIASMKTLFDLLSRAHSMSLDLSSLQTTIIPAWATFLDSIQVPTTKNLHSAKLYVSDESFGRRLVSIMPSVEVLEIEVPGNTRCVIDGSNVSRGLQVLDIRCGTIALRSLLAILTGAPLLQTLKVCRVAEPTGNVVHCRFGIVTHPLLSTFSFVPPKRQTPSRSSNHISFPALRSLDVTAAADDEVHVWPLPCNVVFLRRSGCRLNELIIRNYVIADRITEILSSQHELVNLELNCSGDDTRRVAGGSFARCLGLIGSMAGRKPAGSSSPVFETPSGGGVPEIARYLD